MSYKLGDIFHHNKTALIVLVGITSNEVNINWYWKDQYTPVSWQLPRSAFENYIRSGWYKKI